MLQQTAKNVAECHRRATECAEKAAHAPNEEDRDFYSDAAKRWLFLARSYELSDRLSNVSAEFTRRRKRSADRDYWIYVLNREGRLLGPPMRVPAEDDATAITEAEVRVTGCDAELRDGDMRLIKRFLHEQ